MTTNLSLYNLPLEVPADYELKPTYPESISSSENTSQVEFKWYRTPNLHNKPLYKFAKHERRNIFKEYDRLDQDAWEIVGDELFVWNVVFM